MLTKEEYEEKIDHSPLFRLDKERESIRYETERRILLKMLTEYYVQYIYRDKPLESYSLTLIETAHECIRYYNEGKGAFLHLFNALMKRALRVAVAKEQTERYRQGIRLAREDSYAIRKIIAFAKNKRLDIYDTDCQRKISQVLCLDPERVAELITMNENATAISNRVQGEDDEIDLFDTIADRDISAEEKLIDRSEAVELLKIADAVFSGCKARQKRMISLALTSEVVKAFDEDVEMAEKIMEGFSFRSEEWFVYYRENRAVLTARQIAQICGTSEQSLSRAYKIFKEKIRERR